MKGPKGLTDDEVGGREPMKHRYRIGYETKVFNENLNPLKGWLHSVLGKKWDKSYSELRKTFDARGVINNHILEHLFDHVEVNTKLVDGVVMVLDGYNGSRGYVPLKTRVYNARYPDYYVCPKDGTLKTMGKPPRRSIIKQREAEARAKVLAVKRVLNDKEVLHLVDGVWYHFDLLPVPVAKVVYQKPMSTDVFKIGYHFGKGPDNRREKTWDELNEQERERFGVKQVIGGTAYDEFTGRTVYRDQKGVTHYDRISFHYPVKAEVYHANKKTASKKHLKQAGLV